MPTLTDVVMICFLLFFALDGWRQSFFKSALGPVIFFFCSLFGIIFFDLTQNAVKAVLYTFASSTVINFIVLSLLMLSKRTVDPSYQDYSPVVTRMMGSIVNAAWQGLVLMIILFFIALAPLHIYGLKGVQENIQNSLSFTWIKHNFSKVPVLQRIVTAFSIFKDPAQMQTLSSTEEFRQFFMTPKVQALINDPAFMRQVQDKNYAEIAANPKVLAVLDDNALMDNFNRLAMKMYSFNVPQKGTGSGTP